MIWQESTVVSKNINIQTFFCPRKTSSTLIQSFCSLKFVSWDVRKKLQLKICVWGSLSCNGLGRCNTQPCKPCCFIRFNYFFPCNLGKGNSQSTKFLRQWETERSGVKINKREGLSNVMAKIQGISGCGPEIYPLFLLCFFCEAASVLWHAQNLLFLKP